MASDFDWIPSPYSDVFVHLPVVVDVRLAVPVGSARLLPNSRLGGRRRAAVVRVMAPLASQRLAALPAGRPVGPWSHPVGDGSQSSDPASVFLLTPAVLGVLKVRRAGLLSGMGLPWFTRTSASGRPAVVSSCSLGDKLQGWVASG